MKSLVLLAVAVIFSFTIIHSQTTRNLDQNNGFKKYKLGSKYQPVYGVKSKQADGSDVVSIGNYTKEKIGDIPVSSVQLVYLQDILSRIIVKIEPNYHSQLFEAVKNSFGPVFQSSPTEIKNGSIQTDKYIWKGGKLNLEYFYSYPKVEGSSTVLKDLHLSYSLKDYENRLANSKKGKYTAKDF